MLDLIKSLENEKLAKNEVIALEHFRRKPEGRGFFAVSEILFRYRLYDETIQLLQQGLERHPHYSVARVFLAQVYFHQRFAQEAYATLEASPTPLRSNLTAQILRLKLSVILNMETQARTLCRELSGQDFQDSEAKIIMHQIGIKTFPQLRRDYAEHLQWPFTSTQESRTDKPVHSEPKQHLKSQEPILAGAEFRDRVARGFFSSPISEIFLKAAHNITGDTSHLDDLTKARLLRRQGLYQNSFDIYERLVYSSPSNELLRREFAEIRELRDTQKAVDQQLDPSLAQAMDRVRGLDKRILLLQQLLRRLDEQSYPS